MRTTSEGGDQEHAEGFQIASEIPEAHQGKGQE
jgi:hypothetical protein